jgi:nickel/cobalt exporter
VHAIQPGHGKTLVAATVAGERGGWASGIVLAFVTTAAHVAGVLVIAGVLWVSRISAYGAIHAGLARAAGFVIAAIGLWRLGRHLAGFGEHGEHPPPLALKNRGIIGLGLAGGLVPCWDGILLIVLAEAIGRLALGLILLVAFSLGMATVLVAVGLATARVRRSIAVRDRAGTWERRLGIAGGAALAIVGVALLA